MHPHPELNLQGVCKLWLIKNNNNYNNKTTTTKMTKKYTERIFIFLNWIGLCVCRGWLGATIHHPTGSSPFLSFRSSSSSSPSLFLLPLPQSSPSSPTSSSPKGLLPLTLFPTIVVIITSITIITIIISSKRHHHHHIVKTHHLVPASSSSSSQDVGKTDAFCNLSCNSQHMTLGCFVMVWPYIQLALNSFIIFCFIRADYCDASQSIIMRNCWTYEVYHLSLYPLEIYCQYIQLVLTLPVTDIETLRPCLIQSVYLMQMYNMAAYLLTLIDFAC